MISTRLAVAIVALAALTATFLGPTHGHAQDIPPRPMPPALHVTANDHPGRATISWTEVPGALGYLVWYGPSSSPGGRLTAPVDPSQTQQTIYGLRSSTDYSFHVMVKVAGAQPTDLRWSLWSTPATLLTTAGLPTAALDPSLPICDRPDLFVRRIREALDTHLACNDITVSHLADLTTLDLSQTPGIAVNPHTGENTVVWDRTNDRYDGIVTLQPHDMAGLDNVTDLNISGLGLTHLDPDFFVHLPSLQTLHANSNRIDAIPDHVFSGSPGLAYIDLSYNRISSIGRHPFTQLSDLRVIDLDYNRISTIPDDAISTARHPALHLVSLVSNPGSDSQLSELTVIEQKNAQGNDVFVCLALGKDRQCVQP